MSGNETFLARGVWGRRPGVGGGKDGIYVRIDAVEHIQEDEDGDKVTKSLVRVDGTCDFSFIDNGQPLSAQIGDQLDEIGSSFGIDAEAEERILVLWEESADPVAAEMMNFIQHNLPHGYLMGASTEFDRYLDHELRISRVGNDIMMLEEGAGQLLAYQYRQDANIRTLSFGLDETHYPANSSAPGTRLKARGTIGHWRVDMLKLALECDIAFDELFIHDAARKVTGSYPLTTRDGIDAAKEDTSEHHAIDDLLRFIFQDVVAPALSDPILNDAAKTDYLDGLPAAQVFTTDRGAPDEMNSLVKALQVHTGSKLVINIQPAYEAKAGAFEAEGYWMRSFGLTPDVMPDAGKQEVLERIIAHFGPRGSVPSVFYGNRQSQASPGPMSLQYEPELDASGHDQLAAYEALRDFLVSTGLMERQAVSLLKLGLQ